MNSLVEELQRTLVAHSLDAPEPARSIDAILDRTVGVAPERPSTVGARSHRWRWITTGRVVTIAASAAAVLVAVAVVNIGRSSSSNSGAKSSASSAAGVGSAANRPAGRPGADSAAGGMLSGGAPSSSLCTPDPAPLAVPASAGHQLSVVTTRCWRPSGDQDPSTVTVLDRANPARPPLVLISPTQNLHVYRVYLDGSEVVVQAARWSAAGLSRGAVYDYPFTLGADGTTVVSLPPRLYALSCAQRDISVGPVLIGSKLLRLRLVNIGVARCAVEGYPQLGFASTSQASLPAVRQTASGERVTPLVLAPSGSAFSRVDLVSGCRSGVGVTVSLPAVGLLGMGWTASVMCSLVTVHPFVVGD